VSFQGQSFQEKNAVTVTSIMFDLIEQAIRSGGPEAGLDLLVQKLAEEKNYPLLFEARMLRKRHELGLPLVQMGSIDDVPEDKRAAYERAFTESARETGSLFLANGQIPRAWPYFRAIGESGPVRAAIEKLDGPREELDRVIEIALEERVNPRKGFELMLAHYGICRAITYFEQYPDPRTREECIALLVRTLHHELVENLKRAIAQREGSAPDTDRIPALIASRDWLFGDMDYYADTSHVISVIRFALDLHDPEPLKLALEICEYGGHLSHNFKYRVDPPFEDVYRDHALYLHALLGENEEGAIDHFRTGPPQVHVALLVRLKRYQEAIEFSLEHLRDVPPEQLACPSVLQLCELAGDYDLLRELAREQGDLLSFAAANFRPQSP
jgi:hypothetical protein